MELSSIDSPPVWGVKDEEVKRKEIHCGLLRVQLLEYGRKASCYEEDPVLSFFFLYLRYQWGDSAKGSQRFAKESSKIIGLDLLAVC